MNGAKVIRSTFGFIDTKGKPNELGFYFPVVMEKPTFYIQISRTKYGTGHPLDAQWIVTEKNKTKQNKTRVSLEPALTHATIRGPAPKEEQ